MVNGVWIPEVENEDEVQERLEEYKSHPLFKTLLEYDEELNDFVKERQEKKAKQQKKEQNQDSMGISNQ